MTNLDHGRPPSRCKLCENEADFRFSLPVAGGLCADYFECRRCHLLQSHHLDSLSPEELESFYAATDPSLDTGAAWRQACLVRRIEHLARLRVLPRRSGAFKALDFGCGPGFAVGCLPVRFGWDVRGFEPYADPVYAPHRVFRDWQQVREYGPYQLVIASEVFEHFLQPREEIAKIREILEDHGSFLYVTTGLYRPGKTGADWRYLAPQSGQHVALYSREAIQAVRHALGAQTVFRAGAEYEWLFTFGANRPPARRTHIALASRLVSAGVRCGLVTKIE